MLLVAKYLSVWTVPKKASASRARTASVSTQPKGSNTNLNNPGFSQLGRQDKFKQRRSSKVDACHKAHGEPIQMLTADWLGLVDQFKTKYGTHLHDSLLPAQSYFGSFEEKLADGQLSAETLSHVISLHEEDRQRAQRPEASRQLGVHLDSTLTVETRRKYMSTMPLNSEELRDKYAVMTNMWILAQMRQPGRTMYQDLRKDTWNDLLQEPLSTRNFRLEREVAGVRIVVPAWGHCLEYEFQIRKEAVRFIRTQGLPIQAALWSAYQERTASHGTLGDVAVYREFVQLSSRRVPGRLPKT